MKGNCKARSIPVSTSNPSLISSLHIENKRSKSLYLIDVEALDKYQKQSLQAEKVHGSFDSSVWVLKFLRTSLQDKKFKKSGAHLYLLDVGAIVPRYPSFLVPHYPIRLTSIDFHPQHPDVLKVDVRDFAKQYSVKAASTSVSKTHDPEHPNGHHDHSSDINDKTKDEGNELIPRNTLFDVVCANMVVNFDGDPRNRGQVLKACVGLVRLNGWLTLVLPLACLINSRYLDEKHLETIMSCLGCVPITVKKTNKLFLSIWEKISLFDDAHAKVPRKKIKLNNRADANNFCIIVKPDASDEVPSMQPIQDGTARNKKSLAVETSQHLNVPSSKKRKITSNQRKRARKKKWKQQNKIIQCESSKKALSRQDKTVL